jgi:site-specific DNA recombinase
MRAAIYARRSTDEHQAASLDVQSEESRRFIASQGWTVAGEFLEDAVSRAEFKKRPALIKMMLAADAKAFDVIVTRDETRLGGDGPRTTLLIQDMLDAGVRLFFYASGEEVALDNATARFLVSVRNFASELEREKIASRTREHLQTKARRGYVAGGRCYGYDNIEIRDGTEGRRTRVEYAVNAEQAAIVREIFEWYAAGWGLKKIVKDLNARKVPPPSAGKRGTGSWSPSAVHAMLRRDRYRGVLTWGRLAKGYKKGTKVRTVRPAKEWLHVDAPHLAIIDAALWTNVQARFRPGTTRAKGGRPATHLLSGSRCGVCGGPIAANNVGVAHGARMYLCQYHRVRGPEVCPSSLRRPVEAVDTAVVNYLIKNVVTEDVVRDALRILRQRLTDRMRTTAAEFKPLEEEARGLRLEIDRLVAAIAGGSAPAAVRAAIGDRQTRLAELDGRIRAAKAAPAAVSAELARLEQAARAHLADLRTTLADRPVEARKLLSGILAAPLRFTPEGNRYRIEGQVPVAALLPVPNGVSPGGFEPPLAT